MNEENSIENPSQLHRARKISDEFLDYIEEKKLSIEENFIQKEISKNSKKEEKVYTIESGNGDFSTSFEDNLQNFNQKIPQIIESKSTENEEFYRNLLLIDKFLLIAKEGFRKKTNLIPLDLLKFPFPKEKEFSVKGTKFFKENLNEIERKIKGKFKLGKFEVSRLKERDVYFMKDSLRKNSTERDLEEKDLICKEKFVGVNYKKIEDDEFLVYYLYAKRINKNN